MYFGYPFYVHVQDVRLKYDNSNYLYPTSNDKYPLLNLYQISMHLYSIC